MLGKNPIPTRGFYNPIMQALREMGGSGSPAEVVEKVRQILKKDLRKSDWVTLKMGRFRWVNRCHRARIGLILEGKIKRGSPKGVWEIATKEESLMGSSE